MSAGLREENEIEAREQVNDADACAGNMISLRERQAIDVTRKRPTYTTLFAS